ncbi:MAG: CDP-archaeol synthase [Clostridiales bacterium]|jgi:CDP-diglyceride synthetase|nr:CDP-archaeol synthase [Clostridiales bacterium]
MTIILEMYITLAPIIFAGILNMAWCKSSFAGPINKPIDNYLTLKDKARLFGDNKTWKGFLGIIILAIICSVLWGFICRTGYLLEHNYFYASYKNTILYNTLTGFLLGLAYGISELPNSFMKRRLGISPGKPAKGLKSVFFVFMDQADSLFGCVLVICLFYEMSFIFYTAYVLLGACTHLVINTLLYFLKLRKNMF